MDKSSDRKNIYPYQYNIFKMKIVDSYNAYLLMSSGRFATQSINCIKGLYLYFHKCDRQTFYKIYPFITSWLSTSMVSCIETMRNGIISSPHSNAIIARCERGETHSAK